MIPLSDGLFGGLDFGGEVGTGDAGRPTSLTVVFLPYNARIAFKRFDKINVIIT